METKYYSKLILSFKDSRRSIEQVWRVALNEMEGIHLRLLLAQMFIALLPPYAGSRLRVGALVLAGFDIAPRTMIWGKITITGSGNLYQRLHIGEACWLNAGCCLDLSAPITIGDRVSLGHEVLLMTSTHEIGASARRAGALVNQPIRIGDGVWLGSRCTLFPGITVSEGAVVAAGAIVTKDVPPNTLVAGVPARVIRSLGPTNNL